MMGKLYSKPSQSITHNPHSYNAKSASLRCVRHTDAAFLCAMENDPQVWQYSSLDEAPYSIEEIEQFCLAMQMADGQPDQSGQLRLMIEVENQAVGAIDLYDCREKRAKVAIIIYPTSMRGKGYGGQALNCAIDYCREIGIAELGAEIAQENLRSISLFEGCGFERCDDERCGGDDGKILFFSKTILQHNSPRR